MLCDGIISKILKRINCSYATIVELRSIHYVAPATLSFDVSLIPSKVELLIINTSSHKLCYEGEPTIWHIHRKNL